MERPRRSLRFRIECLPTPPWTPLLKTSICPRREQRLLYDGRQVCDGHAVAVRKGVTVRLATRLRGGADDPRRHAASDARPGIQDEPEPQPQPQPEEAVKPDSKPRPVTAEPGAEAQNTVGVQLVWRDPTEEEMMAHGEAIVGRRVRFQGQVVGFEKARLGARARAADSGRGQGGRPPPLLPPCGPLAAPLRPLGLTIRPHFPIYFASDVAMGGAVMKTLDMIFHQRLSMQSIIRVF